MSRGVGIEAEHSPNKEIQRKITDDHNTELKKYYDKKKGLPAMEKNLEKSAKPLHADFGWSKQDKVWGGKNNHLNALKRRGFPHAHAKYLDTYLNPHQTSDMHPRNTPVQTWLDEEKELLKGAGLGRVAGRTKFGLKGGTSAGPISKDLLRSKAKEKKATIVKPTGALRSNLGPMHKVAAFVRGLLDELEKLGYNGTATKTIRPGTGESKSMRKALKAKGVWEGKSPSLLSRAVHGIRRLGRPKSTAHLSVTKSQKPTSEKEQAKAISSALGGSFSSMPSIPKVAVFLEGFVDELEKLGVTFGKTPGKPMKIKATLRRLKRFVTGAPQSQLRRIERKRQAQSVAHRFSGAARDLRGMARAGKMTLGAGRAMVQREARPVIRAGRRIKGVGPAIAGLIKRNPDLAFLVGAPLALIGGTAAIGGLSKLLTKKKKKGMKKKAELGKFGVPPTLAKLRRAYPKGKVKAPVVAVPQKVPPFPKAATVSGRAKYLAKRLAAPIRRLKAGDKASEAMEKGELRKALRYGGVSAGLGPSFGREPKKAKALVEILRGTTAKA